MALAKNNTRDRNRGFPAPRWAWGPAAVQCEAGTRSCLNRPSSFLARHLGSSLLAHRPGSGFQLLTRLSVHMRMRTHSYPAPCAPAPEPCPRLWPWRSLPQFR